MAIYCINTFMEGTFSSWKLKQTSILFFSHKNNEQEVLPSCTITLFDCFPAINNAVNVVLSAGYARLSVTAEAFNTKLAVKGILKHFLQKKSFCSHFIIFHTANSKIKSKLGINY